jgi:hypothetical protein
MESNFSQCFQSTIKYEFSPQHAQYMKFGTMEIYIDNETLQFRPMITSSTRCLTFTPGMNNATESKTPLQSMLHENFIHEPHQVCLLLLISFQQSCSDHCKFFDMIESWLEESYMSACITNHNSAKFNFFSGYSHESILSFFHPSLLHSIQFSFNQYLIAGLELLDWLH